MSSADFEFLIHLRVIDLKVKNKIAYFKETMPAEERLVVTVRF
jgi:hypothetical protein